MSCQFFAWQRNEYQGRSQISSVPNRAVDAKIWSFLVESPFTKPSERGCLSATTWTRYLRNSGFANLDAFPGDNGEILVSGINGEFCFEVTVECDLSFSITFERGLRLVSSFERLTHEKALGKLLEAVRDVWISTVGFIRHSSTPAVADLPASLSETRPTPTEASL